MFVCINVYMYPWLTNWRFSDVIVIPRNSQPDDILST